MRDTGQTANAIQIEILRNLAASERFLLAFQMSLTARELSLARLRRQHPEWSEAELRRELVRYSFHPGVVPPRLR